jgi:hypothetical protein
VYTVIIISECVLMCMEKFMRNAFSMSDEFVFIVWQDVVLFSIEPPNDFFYIEKYSGRIYIRRSPSENPMVSEYNVR